MSRQIASPLRRAKDGTRNVSRVKPSQLRRHASMGISEANPVPESGPPRSTRQGSRVMRRSRRLGPVAPANQLDYTGGVSCFVEDFHCRGHAVVAHLYVIRAAAVSNTADLSSGLRISIPLCQHVGLDLINLGGIRQPQLGSANSRDAWRTGHEQPWAEPKRSFSGAATRAGPSGRACDWRPAGRRCCARCRGRRR